MTDIETTEEKTVETTATEPSLRDTLKASLAEVREASDEKITETPKDDAKDAPEKAKGTPEGDKTPEAAAKTPAAVEDAPASLSAAAKAKWGELPAEVRAEWSKREADIHKMFTAHDGELRMGRELKEVITPYMATIQAEGGTPAGAVKELLNTAYILRNGNPQQKAAIVQQVCQQYGVDLALAGSPQQQSGDPAYAALLQKMQQLEHAANPETIQKTLQQKMEGDRILSEVKSFAADPKNVYYNEVFEEMLSLASSLRARNPEKHSKEILQEAYDAACWSNPKVRSTLQAANQSAEAAKKKTEIDAKRRASASITGSPSAVMPNSGSPNRSIREELAASLKAIQAS